MVSVRRVICLLIVEHRFTNYTCSQRLRNNKVDSGQCTVVRVYAKTGASENLILSTVFVDYLMLMNIKINVY